MEPQSQSHPDPKQPSRRVRDLPGCIKYVLLLLLLLLLGAEIVAGDFSKIAERNTLAMSILGLKILLILGLCWLIRVQRRLRCDISAPSLCADIEYDAAEDRWIIRVIGTASGTAFSHYELSVEQGGNPFPMNIFYPGGTANGSAAVNNGELGQLQVDGVDPGAGFTVILTVHPVAGSAKTCTSDFEIQRKMIYIEAIGGIAAHVVGAHPDDATEALKLVKANPDPATPDASVGGTIHVTGGADIYGCGREMIEYVLEYREVAPDPAPPWQQDADTAADWVDINAPLPFGDANHPRTYSSWQGAKPNYVTNGVLTRQWKNILVTQSIFPIFDQKLRWVTTNKAWSTGTPPAAALNSRYTVRVRVQHMPLGGPPDAVPPELYDSATVWIDNRVIEANITGLAIAGGGGLDACDELLLSQFITAANTKVNCDINGRAWDPLITDNPPFPSAAPNNNFDLYTLNFQKDGGGMNPIAITAPQDPNTRVPNVLQAGPLPALPGGTGILQSWDIVGALDAGPVAAPDPSPKIYRGERCAYLIQLYVKDATLVGGSDNHEAWDFWPFCIMNDLPEGLPFPVPA